MPHQLDVLRQTVITQSFRALNRVVVPAVKAGLGSPWPLGVGLVVLETTGRVSGLPRQVPLVATRVGDNVNVSTVRRSSQWARNVDADGNVAVWLDGHKRAAKGAVDRGCFTVASLDVA